MAENEQQNPPTDEEAPQEPPSSGAEELPAGSQAAGAGEPSADSSAGSHEEPAQAEEPPATSAEELPAGSQADAVGEPEADSSAEGHEEPAQAEEPAAGEAGSEGAQEAEEAEEPSLDQIVPPEIHGVSIPLIGRLSIRSLAILVCAVALVFIVVLIVGISLWSEGPPRPAARTTAEAPAQQEEGAQPAAGVLDLAALDYEALMEQADKSTAAGDHAVAARAYRMAAEQEDAGLPKVLLARHKLAGALTHLGRYGEALHICESLRSVSRPGDELWKHSLITSIRVLGEQGLWEDFLRHLYLLRGNSARYADEPVLNRWLAYSRAMAGLRVFFEVSKQGTALYDVEPPAFGRAPCAARPLLAEDIIATSGKYGDGTLRCGVQMGELRLLSEGAPLGEVLAAVARDTGLVIEYGGPTHYPVSASLETISPEHALEVVLGSVGLAAERRDGKLAVHALEPVPVSRAKALRAALWGLQEFLILYPESAQVPEAYYALAHLYMIQDRTRMVLDQFDILGKDFPRSLWTVYGRYMAGRTRCELGNWEAAERDMMAVVDSPIEHPLSQSAFLWLAQCQVQLGKYTEAVACFRRALAYEVKDPLTASILYNIAYCLEKSGASPLEVEERYMELRTRFPATEYAREADYRLARMALDRGEHSKAVTRYELYLSRWPLEEERTQQACRDLIRTYILTEDYVRAALLGETMLAVVSHELEYGRLLPLLLRAYEEAGLQEAGLAAIDGAVAATQDARARGALRTHKAHFLVDLDRHDEAQGVLAELEQQVQDRELVHQAQFVRARILMAQGEADQGLELCRQVAMKSRSEETRNRALRAMGRHYELRKQFDKAALAYAGRCPVDQEGGVP